MADTKADAAKADNGPKTIRATVAKRRSLYLGGEHIRDEKGNLTGTKVGVHHVAGAEVEVPEAEYKDLMAAGFLVDPEAPEMKVSEGPQITKTA